MSDPQVQILRSRVRDYIRDRTGNGRAKIGRFHPLPGHAGVSYWFDYLPYEPKRAEAERLVIRLAPEGVPPVGPNDVVRQAKIMEALAAQSEIPTPPVRWLEDDPKWLGRSFFIAGYVTSDKPALGTRDFGAAEMDQCAREATTALARLHRADRRVLPVFGPLNSLRAEMSRLERLLDRPSIDRKLAGFASKLRRPILEGFPEKTPIGCLHGDFNWSNCLFRNGRLVAIIDWELAQVGAVLIDIGWLCLFSDCASWESHELIPRHVPPPDKLAEYYRTAGGRFVSERSLRWFRAFAAYRFGVITAFNLMLHRRGKRHDPMWEKIAVSAPRMFERGRELLETNRVRSRYG
jgi:aminoglycoside phosphotransferase (APT) family kinase protein